MTNNSIYEISYVFVTLQHCSVTPTVNFNRQNCFYTCLNSADSKFDNCYWSVQQRVFNKKNPLRTWENTCKYPFPLLYGAIFSVLGYISIYSLYLVYTVCCYNRYLKHWNVSEIYGHCLLLMKKNVLNTIILLDGEMTVIFSKNCFGQRTIVKHNMAIVHICKNNYL